MIPGGQWWVYYGSRSDAFNLYQLSDLHMFNASCAMEHVHRDIDTIKRDPYGLAVGTGDYAEFIGHDDPRFDPASLPADLPARELGRLCAAQSAAVCNLLNPIRDKLIGIGEGNHEHALMLHESQQDMFAEMCRKLQVRNLGYSSIIDLVFVRVPRLRVPVMLAMKPPAVKNESWRCRIGIHHGFGSCTTPGGKLNKLIQLMRDFPGCDLVLMGHLHAKLAWRQPPLDADKDCKQIVQHDQVGMMAGSYLRSYSEGEPAYSEIRGYSPTALGMGRVMIRPSDPHRKIEVVT